MAKITSIMRFENAVLIFSQILRQISGRNFDEINIFTFYTPIMLFISISQIFFFLKSLKRETKFSTGYPSLPFFSLPPFPSLPNRTHRLIYKPYAVFRHFWSVLSPSILDHLGAIKLRISRFVHHRIPGPE